MGWLSQVLHDYSTRRFFIEYWGFLANHIAHGIIALEKLGASEERVRQWADWYSDKKLEAPSEKNHLAEHPDDVPLTPEEMDDITGKRKRYYSILNANKKKLDECGGDIDVLVKKDFPQLSLGLQASLLHGMIQLGYGYAVRDTYTVLEGLSYLRFAYRPLVFDEESADNDISKFGAGDVEIVDVLKDFKRDDEIFDQMVKRAEELSKSDQDLGRAQNQVGAILEKGNKMISYANRIKLPRDIVHDPVLIADWVLDQTITVFALAQDERRNDFVLLHGVTCAWSVRQVIPLLDREDALKALRTLVCTVFAAYLSVGGPNLTNAVDPNIQVDAAAWNALIQRAIAADIERDEHVYKLIQVVYELWKKHLESGRNAALYYTAAKIALENPYPPFVPSQPRY